MSEITDLKRQFEEGEIELDEYIGTLVDIGKNDMRQEMEAQRMKADWDNAEAAFLNDNPQYQSDPVLRGTLGALMGQMARNGELDGMSYREIFDRVGQEISGKFHIDQAVDRDQPEAASDSTPTVDNIPWEDGAKFERMVAKMTPAEAEAFLAGDE